MAIKPLLEIEKALDDQGLFVRNRSLGSGLIPGVT
jgi:hypothetical protein